MRFGVVILQTMILVHTVDERAVAVNMEQVMSIAEPGEQVTDKSRCLVGFIGGRFVNTQETCHEVGLLWQREDAKKK